MKHIQLYFNRYQKRYAKLACARLYKMWDDYDAKRITASELAEKAGRLEFFVSSSLKEKNSD